MLRSALGQLLGTGGRAAVLALAALLLALPALAQDDEAEGEGEAAGEGEDPQRPAPTIRLAVSDIVQKAETCASEGDLNCALETLAETERIRDLNAFERAYVQTRYANIYIELEDFPSAITAYEQILALPAEELTPGVIQTSLRNLSSLYLQVEPMRARDALNAFERYMALPTVTPTAQDWYLKSVIHYQLDEYENGASAIRQAIDIAEAAGSFGLESWWQLLHVFYYELDQKADVIETLEVLVENWTKRDHMVQLAGRLSERAEEGDQERTLALWEAAYDAGWLERSNDFTALANLHMALGAPYKGALVLEEGLSEGTVESTSDNWRMLAQAWRMAGESDKAIPALNEASELAEDGNIDYELALAHAQQAEWELCADSAAEALERGGLNREDLAGVLLGRCLVQTHEYSEAQAALREAAEHDSVRRDANALLEYIDSEIKREAEIARAMREVEEKRAARAERQRERESVRN